MRVGEMSETDLLARVFPRLPAYGGTVVGPGDDAAVIAATGHPLVITTDVLVQDRHFRLGWGTGADLGWRAAMQNLADVAAMGAVPTTIVVGLVLPPQVRSEERRVGREGRASEWGAGGRVRVGAW